MRTIAVTALACLIAGCATVEMGESTRDVRIVRDDYGVPHIYAGSVYGIFYGYGYAVAQDRLFQMEMARRSTQGYVAEVLGEDYVTFDKGVRTGFSPESIRRQLAELSVADRDIFDGYAAGMNAWIDEVNARPEQLLSKQFSDFGFRPALWSAYDVAMVFVGTMANRYGDFNTELENQQILSELAALHGPGTAMRIFDALNPRFTDNAPTTIAAEDWPGRQHRGPEPIMGALPPPPEALTLLQDQGRSSGFSNCFVLGPEKSRGANAILVNGPQFGWFVPAYVYSVGLHGAGFDMVGNTPFGYPVLLFGHNGRIAWGSTWGAGDIVDMYRETLNPENPGEYLHRGEYRAFDERVEEIPVLGGAVQTITVRRSVHGPIVAVDEAAGIAYAKQRSWEGRELETMLAWLHSGRSTNYDEWLQHAEQAAFNINWYYADTDGNIGYAFVGHYPDRQEHHDNRIPASGDGNTEWKGRRPFSTNPHVLNPRKGYIANWNNKPGAGVPNPDEFWYTWSGADRIDYLHDSIEARKSLDPDEAWRMIESSSYADINVPYFIDLIADAGARSTDAAVRDAAALLQSWDRHSRDTDSDGYYDDAQTPLFRALLGQLLHDVLADDLGEAFRWFAATGYPDVNTPTAAGLNIQVGTKTLVEALAGNAGFDFLNGRSAESVVQDALATTVHKLAQAHGSNMLTWRLPAAPRPFLANNFLGIPQAGADEAMTAPVEQNRGTENNMFVMNPDRVIGYEAAPPGQSGFIAPDGTRSAHYADQFELYHEFGRKRMWFYEDEVEAAKRSEVVLGY